MSEAAAGWFPVKDQLLLLQRYQRVPTDSRQNATLIFFTGFGEIPFSLIVIKVFTNPHFIHQHIWILFPWEHIKTNQVLNFSSAGL